MAKKQLTELGIRKLPVPEAGQKTYWEDGFGVRVSQGGTKTYVVMYGQKPRKQQTLGRFGNISLSEARKEAKRILLKFTQNNAQTASQWLVRPISQSARSRTGLLQFQATVCTSTS